MASWSSAPRSSAEPGSKARRGIDRLGAALLQRRVVEEGVGLGVQDLMGQRRRLRQVPGDAANVARLDPPQERLEARRVHGLVQAVLECLLDQRMIGDLAGRPGCSPGRRRHRGRRPPAGPRPPCAGSAAAPSCRARNAAPQSECSRSSASASRRPARRAGPGSGSPAPCRSAGSGRRCPAGRNAAGPSESSTASSVAAACSSKLNWRQNRLRSARPQARLMPAAERRVQHQLHAARLVEEALGHQRVLGRAGRPAPGAPRPGSPRAARRRPRESRSASSHRDSRPSRSSRPLAPPRGAAARRRPTAPRSGPGLRPARRACRRLAPGILHPHRARARPGASATRCCRAGRCRPPCSRRRSPR